jgi:hypothetical protein
MSHFLLDRNHFSSITAILFGATDVNGSPPEKTLAVSGRNENLGMNHGGSTESSPGLLRNRKRGGVRGTRRTPSNDASIISRNRLDDDLHWNADYEKDRNLQSDQPTDRMTAVVLPHEDERMPSLPDPNLVLSL